LKRGQLPNIPSRHSVHTRPFYLQDHILRFWVREFQLQGGLSTAIFFHEFNLKLQILPHA